ncbi:MAG: DNA-protecting protein DprA [Deltaproteobacteria bacterium]|nr:DNA-protecting protein DprA [Deltaproteobacteria bacterium]MBI4374423.1 DNA-protecting protein DprA [Deltaproteobacteria bacterium]
MAHLTPVDSDYPEILTSIENPPPELWVEGELSLLNQGTRIAIVGTREATVYGKKIAFRLARHLAERGVLVVSGLAYGIDTEAHRGALAGGGKTIAVLGCGIDIPYPKGNVPLKGEIIRSGLVLSEWKDGTPGADWMFPRRNRIISGLSSAVVVVEAAERSGALITADWALSQGREVFAVPGNIDSPVSAGPNLLIRNGATPLLSPEDLFHGLKLPFSKKVTDPISLPPEEKRIIDLLTESRSIDEIAEATGVGISCLNPLLVHMEIEKKIRSLPGGRYERILASE